MKTSYLVSQQVPSYILTEYPAFADFIKAYYQWLEQEHSLPNVESLVDIEQTLDDFIQYFQKELDVFGALNSVNNRFFLKNIKQLYKAKGSELAFKFFFRLVYGKEINVIYPWDRTLKASDGKWIQDTALFIDIKIGSPDLVVGKTVHIQTTTQNYNIVIERYEPVEFLQNGIRTKHASIYQFFINKEYYNQIPSNVRVSYGTEFVGYTTNTSTKVNIFNPGQGFRVGELYDVLDGIGSGSVVKVTKVGPLGEITGLQLVKFGPDYKVYSTASILPKSLKGVQLDPNSGTEDIQISDSYMGLIERGQINKYDYNLDPDIEGPALHPTYAGELLQGFYFENESGVVLDPKYIATIEIVTGSVAKYPGYYDSNDGLLSDDIYLQDNYYYQVYSYVIDVEEQLKTYRSVLQNLLHPSGYALFGQYDVRNSFDIIPSLQDAYIVNEVVLQDEFFNYATIDTIDVVKGPLDSIVTSEQLAKTIGSKLAEALSPSTESGGIWFTNTLYVDVSYIANDSGFYFENVSSSF